MKVHAIVCSYLGDGELDIGKTAAWLNNFVDTTFFYDMNYQTAARHYIVDYAKTFPDAQFAIHPINLAAYWVNPGVFRSSAFAAAKAAWLYDDNDWVIFVDASESLSVNVAQDQMAPPAFGEVLFSYLYNEVAAATGDKLALRFNVFLNQGTVAEHTMVADLDLAQAIDAEQAALTAELATNPTANRVVEINARLDVLTQSEEFNDSVVYWTNHPHYMTGARQSTRMLRVGAAPTFNWSEIDGLASPAPQASAVSIVSYSYARYVEGVPDTSTWTQAADEGFVNRLQMQTLAPRNLGLPQVYATADPAGVAATSPSDVSCPAYCYFVDQFDTGSGNPTFQQWTALWRQNPRDGVWYVNNAADPATLGPVPVSPLTGTPTVDPDQWNSQQPATTAPQV